MTGLLALSLDVLRELGRPDPEQLVTEDVVITEAETYQRSEEPVSKSRVKTWAGVPMET